MSLLNHAALGYEYDTDSQPLDKTFLVAAKPIEEKAWDELIDPLHDVIVVGGWQSRHHHGHGHH